MSKIKTTDINASGTPGPDTYLAGDGSWKTPAGGGGGGGGIYPPNIPSSIIPLTDFTQASSLSPWTSVNVTNITQALEFDGVTFTLENPTNVNCSALLRPLADFGFGSSLVAGDAVVIRTLFQGESAQFIVIGPAFSSSSSFGSGTQMVGQHVAYHPGGIGRVFCSPARYVNFNSRPSISSDAFFWIPSGLPLWVRLVFTGSNTYRSDVSLDGVFWLNGPTLTTTEVMTHAGIVACRVDNFSAARGKFAVQVCGRMVV